MKEEKYNINYNSHNLDIKFDYGFNYEKYMEEVLNYKVKLTPTNEEVLEKMDITEIERFLRKKKLENLKNK